MSAEEKLEPKKSAAGEGAPEASKPKKASPPFDYRIPAGSRWAGMWKVFAGIGGVGLALSGAGYAVDPKRFAFSYLFAFMCALSIALGSLFFIIVERLTSAGWSVAIRRIAEFFASGFPALVVLFLPILACMGSLYPWLHEGAEAKGESHETAASSFMAPLVGVAHAEEHDPASAAPRGASAHPSPRAEAHGGRPDVTGLHGEHSGMVRQAEALEKREEETLAKKAGYLSRGFFLGRVVLYFAAWLFVALRYFRLSTAQDASRDPSFTKKAQAFAPIATILFGLSLTFADVDWVMSLDPSWFSTIFGVTYFAGCAVTIFATLTVVVMSLREAGLLKSAVTVEHFHDLGKLLFGFLVFWAYVNFSQFMLIWYAALPEETTFFHHRWDVGPWANVSLLIVIAHFVVPFFLLISRNVKRRLPALRIGAVWLLVMHCVDIYWLVMPNYNHGESAVSWIDFACLAGVVGTYLALVFRNMTRYPLIPVGDPRLSRSLTFENA